MTAFRVLAVINNLLRFMFYLNNDSPYKILPMMPTSPDSVVPVVYAYHSPEAIPVAGIGIP